MNDTALPCNSGAIPHAVAGATITLAGIECKTYVLDDGRRVIDSRDFDDVFVALMRGDALSNDEAATFARFRAGMATNG